MIPPSFFFLNVMTLFLPHSAFQSQPCPNPTAPSFSWVFNFSVLLVLSFPVSYFYIIALYFAFVVIQAFVIMRLSHCSSSLAGSFSRV